MRSGAFEAILEVGAQRGLPMVVANADYVVMKPGGEEAHMPGTLGQLYGPLTRETVPRMSSAVFFSGRANIFASLERVDAAS